MSLRFYLFVSGVDQRNEGKKWVQEFLVFPQGFWSFSSLISRARWCDLVRFNWRLVLLCVIGVGFERTCIVSGKWNVSKNSHSVGSQSFVIIAGSQSGDSSSNPMCSQFSVVALWFRLCSLRSESNRAWNFQMLVEDSDNGGPSSIAVKWRGWGGDRTNVYMYMY